MRKLPYNMRTAQEHLMRTMTRSVMEQCNITGARNVTICIGGAARPEDYYIKTVVDTLRDSGALARDASVTITTTPEHKKIIITLS